METAVDQDKLDTVMRGVLVAQLPDVRAELLELLEGNAVQVWQGIEARDEEWTLAVAGIAIARVHRSRLEGAPDD